jgi:hypothetical protein
VTVPLSFIERRLRRLDPPAGADPIIGQADIGALATSVVVVLGDPGAGKSVLMEGLGAAPGATFVRATSLVRMADPATRLGTFDRIVVDGVDEVASAVAGGGVDAVLTKLSLLGNPDCILSCRVADWRGAADRSKVADDYGRDAVMLVLQPFEREDAARFLAIRFPSLDAEVALAHLDKRGLQSIYGNPLTLRLLGEAVAAGQALPDSRGELLASATRQLVLELNERHMGASHAERDPDELLIAAGAGAASTLLCDKLGIFVGAEARRPASYLAQAGVQRLAHADALGDALKTRLFSGEEEGAFAPVHRVIAEYLAARWLARCAADGGSPRRLLGMLRQNGMVPTSLRGINAWLAGFSPELGDRCVADDPFGVLRYGDTAVLSLPRAQHLLQSLAALSRDDPYFRAEDWARQSAKGLARAELKPELLAILAAPVEHAALGSLLIEAMHGTPLGNAMASELRAMLVDPTHPYHQRRSLLDLLVEAGAISNWSLLIGELASLGDQDSLRIAAEAGLTDAATSIDPAQLVPVLLNWVGLTFRLIPRRSARRGGSTHLISRQLIAEPPGRLDMWLDALATLAGPFMRTDGDGPTQVVDLSLRLLARRIEYAPAPTAADFARWLMWLREHRGYERKAPDALRAFFRSAPQLRREIQEELLLKAPPGQLWRASYRLGGQPLGLYPDEDDVTWLLERAREREERPHG